MSNYSNNHNNNYGDNYSRSDDMENIYSGKKKNKKWLLKSIIVVFSIIFAIVGSGMIYYYNLLNSVNYDDLSSTPEASAPEEDLGDHNIAEVDVSDGTLLTDSKVLNIVLFGSDHRETNENGRSDTTLVLTIDNRRKKIKITSIMRDLWVHIPGRNDNRINVAYSYGGPKKAIETIERNLGIKIDRYANADFESFEKIVDRLGGIDIELTATEVAYINQDVAYMHPEAAKTNRLTGSGVKHLNGMQTLSHARNRHSAMSDFDRTARQRNVIKAILSKFKTANLNQITGIISDVGPMITTNFKKDEISNLVANSLTYLKYDVEEYRIPQDGNYSNAKINGMYVLVVKDMKKERYDLAKFIYEDSVKNS